MFSFTLYSGLSARSRPRRSVCPAHRLRQGILPCQLRQIVPDAVLIKEVLRLKLSRRYLAPQAEGDPGVDHGLPPQHLPVVVRRDVDVGEHLQIRQPADGGTGMAALELRHPHLPGDLAPFKVQASTPCRPGRQ